MHYLDHSKNRTVNGKYREIVDPVNGK